ncbi:WYL domain-containing protein [Flavihumibacter sediminis]|nr:WYL domain-containing protein [Flavihumibacter sediminis]
MPLNKSFQRRIEVLDACFRRRQRVWTIDTLLQEVNEKLEGMGSSKISRRSLYDDLKELTLAYDAPVEKYPNGKQTCYRYSNPDFSIRNLPLKQEEVGYLRDALDILRQVQGFQLTQELEAVIGKLENTLATSVEKRHRIIQFEIETLATGRHWLDDIFQAVKEQTVLNIRYKPFHKEAEDFLFHPYLLKEYRNRWFVIGCKGDHQSLTTLALDRIEKLKASADAYKENTVLDPDTYFESLVGVTIPKGGQAEKVLIRVHPDLAPYVLTKPIHASQKLVKTGAKGDVNLELFVVNNYELRSVLLGLGPRLKVLEPETLRDQMKAMYEEGLAAY